MKSFFVVVGAALIELPATGVATAETTVPFDGGCFSDPSVRQE